MQYISNTPADRKEMLKVVGVPTFKELLSDIPKDLIISGLNLPSGISELELLAHLRRTGQKNTHSDRAISFLGAGNYDHYIPPIVNTLATRGEFITAYTPYQPEASQGTLQTIYEFQSLICRLTRMHVANASMYDGASSLAEAALLALRTTDRRRILVSEMLHPESIETLETYLANIDSEIVMIPQRGGLMDQGFLEKSMSRDVALLVFQTPNFLGYLENAKVLVQLASTNGALTLVSVNPLSLAVVMPPGEYGADIVVGEGQPLGNPISYGGPHFGFFATTKELLRRIPGRLCGMTEDLDGKRAYVLTLQAREQHIRREKATSNICTNHALCALKATIFLSVLGGEGFRRLGELNVERSHRALERLSRLKEVAVFSDAPFFNEFTIRIQKNPSRLAKSLAKHRVIGPLHLDRFGKKWQGHYLVAVTEQRTDDDIERLVKAIKDAK